MRWMEGGSVLAHKGRPAWPCPALLCLMGRRMRPTPTCRTIPMLLSHAFLSSSALAVLPMDNTHAIPQTHTVLLAAHLPDFNLDFYTEVQDLTYLVQAMGNTAFSKRFRCVGVHVWCVACVWGCIQGL